MWRIAFFLSMLGAPAAASTADLISFLSEELSDIRETIEQRDVAPVDPGIFETGASEFQDDLNILLDKALSIIGPDTHSRWSEAISEIEGAILEAENYRDELRLERFGAETSTGVGMLDKLMGRDHERGSIEDLDARLNEAEATIEKLKVDRESAEIQFANEMRERHNIDLSASQARALLYSVNGPLIVEASVVLQALAEIERQMVEIIRDNSSVDARSTYTGIASLTRLIHVRMLQRHLDTYNGAWLPKLSNMRSDTEALLAETRWKARNATDEYAKATFENNVIIQNRIVDVIKKYETRLKGRRQLIEDKLENAEQRAAAAVNTLKTLESASAVFDTLQEAESEFNATQIELPDFEDLDADEVEHFLDISRSLGS